MKEFKNSKISLVSLVSKIRNNFGDDNIFLTFNVKYEYPEQDWMVSTFAIDNMEQINGWISLMHAKFVSGSISTISLVFRRFLDGENNMVTVEHIKGKKVKIPQKEIYHFLLDNEKCITFDEEETFTSQNTDSNTGKKLTPQKDIICKSSIQLVEELYNNKYNIDDILDKISEMGEENLTKSEKKFLDKEYK